MKKLLTTLFYILTFYYSSYSDNSIIIKEINGDSTQYYPVQFARPFTKGEILNYPQAVINSQPILTQADVKCRWEDGSVKHSVITFYLPMLNPNDSIKVNFINQETGNNNNYLQIDSMLSTFFDFEAQMIFINDLDTIRVSAREMLGNDHLQYWLKGAICTSVILADHSRERQYDFGFNQAGGTDTLNRSIRPIYHITFFPLINKIKIRYIAEISNSERIQDQTYSLILKAGNTNPEQMYSKSQFIHHGLSRWTKEYWLGEPLPKISINHNLPYLTQTRLIPNYDTTKAVPQAVIQSEYNNWLATDLDINGNGSLYKYMPGTGGRPDIGPYPSWVVRWLYSGDKKMEEQSLINANLAGAYPMCLRECDTSKFLNRERTVSGLGKIASITDRPTIFFNQGFYNFIYQTEEDRIDFVGAITDNGWIPDNAHQPDVYSIPYLLTGDYWYLEQLMFWAGYGAANSNGAATVYSFGRGPTGSEGGLPHEIRGQAWAFRTRVNCASIIPDEMPEKEYFNTLINDAISIWEGSHNILESPNYGSDCWNWGNEVYLPGISFGFGNGPLHFWEIGNTGHVQNVINPDSALMAVAPWQLNMMIFSLGRAEELGYPTTNLRKWAAKYLADLLTDPSFSPYYCALYRLPTIRKSDSTHFQNWTQVRQSLDSINFNLTQEFFDTRNDVEHGYANIAMCASSFITDVENGSFAYYFTDSTLMNNPLLNNNPKWAIKTRNENLVFCQNIPLQLNWNNISAPLLPYNADLNYIFANNNIRIMKDGNGGIFFPEYGINTIGDWDIKKGYLLNVNSAQTLNFKGTAVNTSDYIFELNEGWKLISYIKQNPMPIESALNTIINHIKIVKDGYGGLFAPSWNINTIGNMLPNRGYWIYMNDDAVLVYP